MIVDVIRCKDCKKWIETGTEYKIVKNGRRVEIRPIHECCEWGVEGYTPTKPDEYCSRAERREK